MAWTLPWEECELSTGQCHSQAEPHDPVLSAVQLSTLSHLSPPSESTGSPSGVLTTQTFTKGLDKAKRTLGASYR